MIDLTTTYMGFELETPLVASAGPLCKDVDNVRRMEDAGVGAVVLHSLFEEQILIESLDLDHHLSHGTEAFAESLTYFPDMGTYNLGPDGYLEHVRRCKQAVDVPIIGSLNGATNGGWVEYAKKIEDAGADALELNVYFLPTDPTLTSSDIERQYLDLVREVRANLTIPLAVKLSPFFSSTARMLVELDRSGADALVLFNRFYQPDFDLDNLEVVPNLALSDSSELRLRLLWVAVAYGHVDGDLAITGGVHTAADVLKGMMAGAKVTMLTSALLKHGIEWLGVVREGILEWMEEREYESIQQMQGSMSRRAVADPATFERANYVETLRSYALRSTAM